MITSALIPNVHVTVRTTVRAALLYRNIAHALIIFGLSQILRIVPHCRINTVTANSTNASPFTRIDHSLPCSDSVLGSF